MAKKIKSSSADADCSNVIAYLQSQTMFPAQPSQSCLEVTRVVHRLTHSLILWRFRLKRIPEHGQVFIEEVASDALQILPQLLRGYLKPVKLLTRGVIENTLRHVYFSDHPIEFDKMNRQPKWYVSVEELFDYAKDHPVLLHAEQKFGAIHKLRTFYSDLSAGVHGRRVQDFQMNIALSKIIFDDAVAAKETEMLAKTTECVNFILAAFHLQQYLAFEHSDRKLILGTISTQAKQALTSIAS